MPDHIDMAVEISDLYLERRIRAARQPVPIGVPGECEQCYEDSPRLVGGRCAPCRDGKRR
ncbi:conjugal transfer protein TraR [Sphingomonas sp. TREG-RG-20F-R18-01]|uniref:conjugal transfer protein TraR n=1 Tax=Sphingomonas sp. TREG-RG-20F-R18-01 TaxID=2914982 RepID=UPI001F566D3E|nr:conjugal transfer protein TraR [Sphingomonas sp. TREG-RG-20F-R18-01]